METIEAPVKIYVRSEAIFKALHKRRKESDIEYTQTNVIIEKVKKFLNKKDDRDYYTVGYIKRHLEEIIKEIGL